MMAVSEAASTPCSRSRPQKKLMFSCSRSTRQGSSSISSRARFAAAMVTGEREVEKI